MMFTTFQHVGMNGKHPATGFDGGAALDLSRPSLVMVKLSFVLKE
jgi:hypothetical protein